MLTPGCHYRDAQPLDIHAMTAAVLLEKFLGPSQKQAQDDLVPADGTLKRADVSQRPNHTWHGATMANDHAGRVSSNDIATTALCMRQLDSLTRTCWFTWSNLLQPCCFVILQQPNLLPNDVTGMGMHECHAASQAGWPNCQR